MPIKNQSRQSQAIWSEIMKKLMIFLSLLAFSLTATADEFLYILSARAKILSAPSFSAPAIENVTKGEKLVGHEKTQRWYKVSYKGKEGWVSRLAVSPNPPMKRLSKLASADTDISENSRRRANAVSTTAAVRGLRGDERSRISDEGSSNFAMLSQMEALSVSEEDVLSFQDAR